MHLRLVLFPVPSARQADPMSAILLVQDAKARGCALAMMTLGNTATLSRRAC